MSIDSAPAGGSPAATPAAVTVVFPAPPSWPWRRAALFLAGAGNLAIAHIRQGSRDAAVTRLHQAIDVTERNRGGGGLNVIFGAGRELRAWRQSGEVQDVYDRIMALMAA
jgi:hypothetical protein